MKTHYLFLLFFGLSLSVTAQVKLSNGLSYKIHSTPGKPANYLVADIGKNKTDVSKPNRYIVKFKSDPLLKAKINKTKSTAYQDHLNFDFDLNKIENTRRQKSPSTFSATKIHHHFKSAFNGKAITASSEVVEELRKLSYVHSIVEDKQIKVSDNTSNGIIQADKVWNDLSITGKGIVIGIIDTGIDYNHPDIGDGFGPGHKVIGGYDFVNDDNDPMDDHGHGTHVSGIAAGNGSTLKGVAPEAKLMAFKVLAAEGWGYSSWIIGGIERCVDPDQNPDTDDKVDVVNMSLGGPANGPDPMSEAVDNAVEAGVVFAIAAGNSGNYQTIGSPGIAKNAITVGATDSNDMLAWFSSKGPSSDNYSLKPDICAPGVDIYSSLPGGKYASWSGTSMATPHVAGAAALLLQLHPDWSPAQVKAALMENASPLSGSPFEVGTGRLDVLNAANATYTVTPGSISFGILDKSQPTASKSFQLTVTNFSNTSKTYTLTPSGDLNNPAVTTSIDQTSFSLGAGASKVVNVSVIIQTASLAIKEIPDLYLGFVNVSDNSTSVKVPVGFVNPQTISVHLDQPLPTLIVISGADNFYYKNIFPTSSDFDIPLPTGNYNFIAYYDWWNYIVAKEMVSVPGSASLSISKSEASNTIVHNPVDENGDRLTFPSYALGLTSLTESQGAGGGVIFGGVVDTLHVSSLSENWTANFLKNDVVGPGSAKIYSLNASLEGGVSHSVVLTNSPDDLVAINYDYNQDPNSLVDVTGSITDRFSPYGWWSIFSLWPRQMPSSFTEYHQKAEKKNNGTNVTTQQFIDATASIGYKFQTPQLSIYKNDTVVFYKSENQDVTDTKHLTGQSLRLRLNETLLQLGSVMVNDETKILVNPFSFDGYFVNNRGDKVLGKVNYSLSDNAGLVRSGTAVNVGRGEGWIWGEEYIAEDNLLPGSYSLNMNFNDYQVQGRNGYARADLNFNTAAVDKNPPYLTQFKLTVNGQLVNHFNSGETAKLTLSVSDANWEGSSGVEGYSLQYKKTDDSVWKDIALENDVVTFPTSLEEGFYSLKFYSFDNAGNTLTYTLEPAFLVGANPDPIPFAKPSLISPMNHATLVAQNSSFTWNSLESAIQYHFEISTDSSFSKIFRSGDYAGDSIQIDTLLKSQSKYFWRVNAKYSNGVSPWSDPFSFTTGVGFDIPLKLITPANNSTDLPAVVMLKWSRSQAATGYQFQMWNNGRIMIDAPLSDTVLTASLSPGLEYKWRVRALSPQTTGEWTSFFKFTVKTPTLSILYPENQQTGVSITPTLSWSDDFWTNNYRIQVSTSPDFSTLVFDKGSISTTYQLQALQYETTYYWRVQGNYYANVSVWSDTWSFQTEAPSLQKVILLSPSNSIINQELNGVFTWQALPVEAEYKLLLSLSQDFSDPVIVTTNGSSASINNLKPFTTYYWKVDVTYQGVDYSSDPWTFQTKALNIVLLSPSNSILNQELNGVFTWQTPVDGEYKLLLSLSQDFSDPVIVTTNGCSASINDLKPLTTYYWKVDVTYQGVNYSSDTWTFQTKGQNVELLSPASNSVDQGLESAFTWQPLPVEAEYKLFLSSSQDFSVAVVVTTKGSNASINDLKPLTTYYWKVEVNYQGVDYSSGIFSFITKADRVTGIEEKNSVKIFPNPASSAVNFQFSSSDSHEVSVMNSLGQQVWTFSGSEQTATWYTSSIQGGLFFALIKDGGQTVNAKIVIQH